MKKRGITQLCAIAAFLLTAGPLHAQSQGVTDKEVLIGSIQDLSGPLAGFSKMAVAGMQMRVDEINNAGGINGRRLRLMVEDSAYTPTRAVQVAQKLVNQDRVFVMAGSIGSVVNNAAMPIQFEKNVMNFAPSLPTAICLSRSTS